jgi:hypothetical protein
VGNRASAILPTRPRRSLRGCPPYESMREMKPDE